MPCASPNGCDKTTVFAALGKRTFCSSISLHFLFSSSHSLPPSPYTLSAPRLIKPFSSQGQTFKARLGNLLLKQQTPPPLTPPPLHAHTQPTSYPNTTLFMAWSSTSTYIITGLYIHYYTAFHHHHNDDLRSDCFHMGRSNTLSMHIYSYISIFILYIGLQLLFRC